jgi:hypothetical protein
MGMGSGMGMPSAGSMGGMGMGIGMPGGGFPGGPNPESQQWMHDVNAAAQQEQSFLQLYVGVEGAKERAELKGELKKTLEWQFDLQQKRREKELAEVETRVKKLRETLDKRKAAKEQIVTDRVNQLISNLDGLGWQPPAEEGGAGGMPPGMGPGGMPGGYPGMPGGAGMPMPGGGGGALNMMTN